MFFLVVTPLQITWALLVAKRRVGDARLLAAGGLGNLAIAAVWLVSRTIGIPFGPEALQAEAAGVKDVLATTDELLLATLVAVVLLRPVAFPAPRAVVPLAWTCAVVSALAAMVAGH